MKNGMKEHIHAIQYHGAPADVLIKLAHDCGFYLRVEKVNSRPQFVTDVYNIMMSHPQATDEWATFYSGPSDGPKIRHYMFSTPI